MSTPNILTLDALLGVTRCGKPVLSPDGVYAVFVGKRANRDTNTNDAHLYRVPVGGGPVEQLTHQGSHNADPAFAPDGSLAFTSNRSGTHQVWLMPHEGEPRVITRLPLGAQRPVWFPDGKRLLVHGEVFPEMTDYQAMQEREKARVEAGPAPRIVDELMFRHWDTWADGKVSHLFVVEVSSGNFTDLTPGPFPAPPISLTSAPDYAVSPDGTEVAFVSLRTPDQATSTSIQVYTVPARGGEPKRVSTWDGAHMFPSYAPDGTQLAFCAMAHAGYEADGLALMVLDRASGVVREVAPSFDRSAHAPAWTPDSKHLLFSAQDEGRTCIFRVSVSGGEPKAITEGSTDGDPVLSADGQVVFFTRETIASPAEVSRVAVTGGAVTQLTAFNHPLLGAMDLPQAEDFWFDGALGARVHGMLLRPPGFRDGMKYPVVFLIHGGPQSMFGLDFHERWCSQLFAAQGYVTVMINPRGSTGYGQDFTDAIRGEWGGACYQDLMKGFDHVLATYDFCDPERTAAAGASFGGYMVNWMAGHTDRFKCMVCHDGIFNTEMMEYATDELWFTEWEFNGLPWENPEDYVKWSPHRFIGNATTPMLIIHGEQDFRCVSNEGFTLFTALRRQGVPAKLVWFPDEGHWVLKPKNRELWWTEVLGWLESYLKV